MTSKSTVSNTAKLIKTHVRVLLTKYKIKYGKNGRQNLDNRIRQELSISLQSVLYTRRHFSVAEIDKLLSIINEERIKKLDYEDLVNEGEPINS